MKTILTLLSVICMSVTLSAQTPTPSDPFVRLEGKQFKLGCDDWYPMGINYSIFIKVVRDANGNFVEFKPMPTPSTFNYSEYHLINLPWNIYKDFMKADFERIEDMGFNHIRVIGMEMNSDDTLGGNLSYVCWDDTINMTPGLYPSFFAAIDSVVSWAAEYNLKTSLLSGHSYIHNIETPYCHYLEHLVDYFKDDPNVFSYEVFSEPSCQCNNGKACKDQHVNKQDVVELSEKWYNAVRSVTKNQLVTIGLFGVEDIFKWDPSLLHIDYMHLHVYPFSVDYEKAKAHFIWLHHHYDRPWIVGETALSAIDWPGIVYKQGSLADQVVYAEESLKWTYNCGGSGYTWFTYRDANYLPLTDPRTAEDYLGLIERHGPGFLTSGSEPILTMTEKPAADVFRNYTLPTSPGPIPTSTVYYNWDEATHFAASGYVYDANGNPIEGAYVHGAKTIGQDEFYNNFTITDASGFFSLKMDHTSVTTFSVTVGALGMDNETRWYNGTVSNQSFTLLPVGNIPVFTSTDYNYEITNPNVVWDYPVGGVSSVRIKTGASLCIKSNVWFQEDARLIIEQGGKLILDGGTLSSSCATWKGVVVEGNGNDPQIPESNQGVLVMKNGATIENAEVAVYVGQYVLSGVSYGGGIAEINGAHFRNNGTDIWMRPYPGNSQESYIYDSEFKSNDQMAGSLSKHASILLHWVDDLKIEGNTFINEHPASDITQRGIAVKALESSFRMKPYQNPQLPPFQTKANTIENYHYGVHAVNGTHTNHALSIRECEITGTHRAIFLSGTYSAEVLLNDIRVEDQPMVQNGQNDPGAPYGIYLNGGKGFKVEENVLWRPASSSPETFNGSRGIVVHKTGAINNEVYKNTVNNLFVSHQAQCYNSGDGTHAKMGLKFLCNTSQTHINSYDFWIGGSGYCTPSISLIGYVPRFGIAEYQKQKVKNPNTGQNTEAPAGNRFSSAHASLPSSAVVDFDNGEAGSIKYSFQPNSTDRQEPNKIDNVTPDPLSISFEGCPSKIPSGGSGLSLSQLYTELNTAQITYNSSQVLFSIWKDGGNTNLENEVQTIQPWDVYVEFNALLAESPYLSNDVVLAVIENPAFTSLMVKLLMIANPHAIRNSAIVYALENRNPIFPQTYIDEIKAQPETASQLEILEGNVAADYHLITSTGETIKGLYRRNSTKDSLLAFLNRSIDLYDRYELAIHYLNCGQYDDMQAIVDDIAGSYEKDEDMLSDFTNFETMLTIARNMYEGKLYEGSLTVAQQNALVEILEGDRPWMSPVALSLLMRNVPEFVYDEPVYNVQQSTARKANSATKMHEVIASEFSLFPNPAKDFVTLKYSCNVPDLNYIITDISGKELIKQDLGVNEGCISNEVLIDLTALSSGSYFLQLKGNYKLLWTEKLIISK